LTANQDTVLIVDDERSIRVSLRTILSTLGFSIVEASRGEEAIALVRTARFDAVLLDINMPGIGGIDVCRRIRKLVQNLPILMLTVQGSEDRKIQALDAGADDYITKPFHLGELTARLRVAVRRNKPAVEADVPIQIGEIRLDPDRHTVTRNGRRVHMTPKEFDVLQFLMVNAGRPVPHGRLLRSVWGPEYGDELEYLRTFIRQIRTKIENDPSSPRYLLTESHIGYRFAESDSEE
jgi:two-component system KDP operon response regulator KdpE